MSGAYVLEINGKRILQITDCEPRDWKFDGVTHAVVCLPADPSYVVHMQSCGWTYGDRTILASLSHKCLQETECVAGRLTVNVEQLDANEAFPSASEGFYGDRRFYLTPECDRSIGDAVLMRWLKDTPQALVCRFRGVYAGFLHLREEGNVSVVRLAATVPRYRLAGSALALYTTALKRACDHGASHVEGRISSRNVAVMNLYASLGAKFSDAQDVFLKKVV